MKIISFFNHKGGVSKTTTTYHLGWMLTQKGKRVLLVDSDSQCNLTLTIVGEKTYEEFASKQPDNNIRSGLLPAFESKPEMIMPVKGVKVKTNNKLFLLPGSFDITEFETQLSVSFTFGPNSFSTLKNLPGSFHYLIKQTAEKYKADYVLIDLNPSLSAINQILITSSDFFILPAAPDYFSQLAIRSIARILPVWENWAKQARPQFKDSTYPLPNVIPKFLGYTINNYSVRNQKPASAFADLIKKIDVTVRDVLVPALESAGLLLPSKKYRDEYCLAQVSNFQSLQAKYQTFGVPVFALTQEMINSSGFVKDTQKERITGFKNTFSNFADSVLELTK